MRPLSHLHNALWIVLALGLLACDDDKDSATTTDAAVPDETDTDADSGEETPTESESDASVDTDASDGTGGESSSDPSTSSYDFSAFDKTIAAYIADNELAGASAVVVDAEAGEVYIKGYGSFSEDRDYLIASGSKVLSAGVLVHLADQGLLNLDDAISTYLGAWGTYKTDITVAQLLSNSSGLLSLTDNPFYIPYVCQYSRDLGSLSDCGQQIYQAEDEDDRITPDTEFRYGGAQWQLAGAIAEAVSGLAWDDLLEDTYRSPCGTASLGYTNHYQDTGGVGYPSYMDGDSSTLYETDNPNIEGGAYINVRDYGKILLMHLRGGTCDDEVVLEPTSVQRMQENRIASVYGGTTGDADLDGYGLGWWMSTATPGVVLDPGAYGAVAYLDMNAGFGVFIAVEDGSGGDLFAATYPTVLDALSQ